MAHAQQGVAIGFGDAAFITGEKRGAELCRLRTGREYCSNAFAVHDAARGDNRNPELCHALARELQSSKHGISAFGREHGAVPARFEALGDDGVDSALLERKGLLETRYRSHAKNSALSAGTHMLRREHPEDEAEGRGLCLEHGGELRFKIRRVGRSKARIGKPELVAVRAGSVERRGQERGIEARLGRGNK